MSCYKVKIIQTGDYLSRSFYSNYIIDSKIITEMYVTDSIKLDYHPIIKNKQILKKYYPMEIKRYFTKISGYTLNSITTNVNPK